MPEAAETRVSGEEEESDIFCATLSRDNTNSGSELYNKVFFVFFASLVSFELLTVERRTLARFEWGQKNLK